MVIDLTPEQYSKIIGIRKMENSLKIGDKREQEIVRELINIGVYSGVKTVGGNIVKVREREGVVVRCPGLNRGRFVLGGVE